MMLLGLPASEYHSDLDIQSCSLLKPILISPADYLAQFPAPSKRTTSEMEFGTLVHQILLEPHDFHKSYAIYPGKLVRKGEAYESFCALNPGLVVIDEATLLSARTLAHKIREHTYRGRKLGAFLDESDKEVSIYYTDPTTGIQCRTRIDFLHPDITFDLKTTSYASSPAWIRHALSLSYDMQAYMYSLAVCLFRGTETPPPFVFVAADSSAPHSVSTRAAGERFMHEGMRKYQNALASYLACNMTGHWPDLSSDEVIELDHWQTNQPINTWQDAVASTIAA